MGNVITCNRYQYLDSDILSGSCFIGNSLAGEELTIDTLNATMNVDDATFQTADGFEFQTADGSTFSVKNPITGYQFGDIIKYENDGTLIGKFYLEKQPVRSGVTKYNFPCVSAIGLLEKRKHYGGIYVEVQAGTIIADIMSGTPYTIYTDVSTVSLNGWLPVESCRENLRHVLFAIGAGVFKDTSGDIVIKFIEPSTPVAISDSRIYMDGTSDPKTPCTRVDVTEHLYSALSADDAITLYEATDSVTSQRVLFDKPCHDLAATGLTIEESGVNYAIVSGTGTLTGKAFTHTQRVISYDTGITGTENIMSVKDATLVSAFNSYNVAKRVAQYYSEVSAISIGLVVGTERPATEVAFTDPFGEAEVGYVKSLDMTMSTVLKAKAEIAIGFLPTGHGNNFNNYVVLTGSGTWTVPAGVTRIYEILVGGGDGGHGGNAGATSSPGTLTGGDGGAAGDVGLGALIFTTNTTVAPGQTVSYACGTGGPGGTQGNNGSNGSATTFGSHSSTSGRRYSSGYSEPKSGLILAQNGVPGIAGGRGSSYGNPGPNVTYNGNTYHPGANGTDYYTGTTWYRGGQGGGAAAGANGGDGTNATYKQHGGGGQGATPVGGTNGTQYGQGGGGGHGGGGGGGTAYSDPPFYSGVPGGAGGVGGQGGPGCIIIYY